MVLVLNFTFGSWFVMATKVITKATLLIDCFPYNYVMYDMEQRQVSGAHVVPLVAWAHGELVERVYGSRHRALSLLTVTVKDSIARNFHFKILLKFFQLTFFQ